MDTCFRFRKYCFILKCKDIIRLLGPPRISPKRHVVSSVIIFKCSNGVIIQ